MQNRGKCLNSSETVKHERIQLDFYGERNVGELDELEIK